jgi:hypothetical protein
MGALGRGARRDRDDVGAFGHGADGEPQRRDRRVGGGFIMLAGGIALRERM